ncbi:transcriptional regulator family: Fungal Specific TF [Penicillium pulvis]|uniref:transcriptional regulator family: Fungal Specific TF n=1 Tax=Penicillium pulvis TaxID=1562058 RepID=UPI002549A31A|nr:transcriptional regulator family: Fungal Specific TF [Penicillium pulvis]KAJ5786105.1 transcriptional regulator family: Fungal Specific TF [Penicillium pulvis]
MEPEGSDHDEYEVPNNGLSRRACDQCRTRKIRCDKRSPCSNCRSSKVVCRSTGEGQKPQQQRRRVLISSQYEKKIDLMEERLGNIEKALQELVTVSRLNGARPPNSYGSSQPSPLLRVKVDSPATKSDQANLKGPGYTSNPAIEQHDPSSGFEGNSSLAAHSAYAREFLESAFSHSTPEVLSSPKINEALSSLRQIVEMQNKQREIDPQRAQFPDQENRLGARFDVRQLELPPLSAVLIVLRNLKEHPTSSFSGYIPFFEIDYFIEKCRDVYFSTDDYSDAAFIAATFGLYSIFIELSFSEKEPATRNEYNQYVQMCKDGLEAALANLNILMPATHEYIVALSLGALHGVEISKPSLSWTLASTAMHMCQTLGYHRISSMEHDPPSVQKEKQCLFWSVYTILNLMSLRLGRASVIQDFDIALPSPFETFPCNDIWGHICALWTTQAMIQNKVYTTLYSPAALNQPESVRVSHARSLAAEMKSTIIEPFERMMSSDQRLCEVDILYLQCDKVSRLSMLTLIYRAIPAPAGTGSSSTFIPECVETARAALEHHQMCFGTIGENNKIMQRSYMHWAILVSPFVPFIVIFCHVIATSDKKDLTLLEDFIASLHTLCSISQSVDRLHNICSVFGTVARLYVEAKTRNKAGEDSGLASVGQEFDVYLSALGLAPSNAITSGQGYFQPDAMLATHVGVPESATHMTEVAGPLMQPQGQSQETMSEAEMMQATQLGNWFSGNQYMMGLLEEDLVQFNPNI